MKIGFVLGSLLLTQAAVPSLWSQPASPSGGAALTAQGGVSITPANLQKMLVTAGDPCLGAPVFSPAPPPQGPDPEQTPPVLKQWRACFPTPGGLPADPQIAAGQSRLVITTQTRLGIFEKSGTYLGSVTADKFFEPLGLDDVAPGLKVYRDFRAVYDERRRRFWVGATVSNRVVDPAKRRVMFAVGVSKTTDPLDGWWLYWWDAVTGYGDAGSPVYQAGDVADDPFLGIDAFGVHQTNRVSNGGVDRYWRVAFFRGSSLANGVPASGWQYWDLTNVGGSAAWQIQPVVHHGLSPRAYYVSRQGGNRIVVWGLSNPLSPAQNITRAVLPLSSPWALPPNAPQSGSGQLVRMDRMGNALMKAVYRNDRLYLVSTDGVRWERSGPLYASVRSQRLDVSTFPALSTAAPDFFDNHLGPNSEIDDDPGDHNHSGWPTVEVNGWGHIAFSYARSGATLFPEMRWSLHKANEPEAQASRRVRAGAAPYAIPGNASAVLPWGEVSGASVDPYDDIAVWMTHQYATSGGGGSSGNYGIWVAKVFGQLVINVINYAIRPDVVDGIDPGMPIDFEQVFANMGDGPVERFDVAVLLVSEDGRRIPLGMLSHNGLRPGESETLKAHLTVPLDTPAGKYHLQSIADPFNVIEEYDETDNRTTSVEVVQILEGQRGE
jgi:hypothetical protein